MNILYIGYWGANEGLSQATIYPHLRILDRHKEIKSITYISIERSHVKSYRIPRLNKLIHKPLFADKTSFRLINKIYELMSFSSKLVSLAREEKIDLVICRSSLAGNYGLKIFKSLNIPFVVESFEPHAEYMRKLGHWKWYGLSFQFQRKLENNQKKYAFHLYPVADNYRTKLIFEGLKKDNVTTLPCAVDTSIFRFNIELRREIRSELGIKSNTVVAIYVGKFGGIYFNLKQAFQLFRDAFQQFKQFHLILLTPEEPKAIYNNANAIRFPISCLTVAHVPHNEVPNYLSASDFAFSLHYPAEPMKYVSPIKNGEYWASGLPVVISDDIGDDSELLKSSGLGIIIEEPKKQMFNNLMELLKLEDHRAKIYELAVKHRNFSKVEKAYNHLIDRINSNKNSI